MDTPKTSPPTSVGARFLIAGVVSVKYGRSPNLRTPAGRLPSRTTPGKISTPLRSSLGSIAVVLGRGTRFRDYGIGAECLCATCPAAAGVDLYREDYSMSTLHLFVLGDEIYIFSEH